MKNPMIGSLVMEYDGALGMIHHKKESYYYVEWLIGGSGISYYHPAEIEEMLNRYKKYRMENPL